jgi:predicted phage terminase large subunit-like protein
VSEDVTLRPHKGPQTEFLSTSAQITVFGGSAGGGKSFALFMDPLRHINTPDFYCIMFRRQAVEIGKPGGLADASRKIYPLLGGEYFTATKTWKFPSGAKIVFMGLDHIDDVEALRGVEISRLYFDELTTFHEVQFWYPMTRIRSTNGISGKTKATTNPQSTGFVKDLISWYLDDEGFAIEERSGVLRYFLRDAEGSLLWFDSEEEGEVYSREVMGLDDDEISVTSFTFIRSSLDDNPSLGKEYKKTLLSMPPKQRAELLGGNWNYDSSTGVYFKKDWVETVSRHKLPEMKKLVRGWDLASTPEGPGNKNPDWTAGIKLGLGDDGYFYILDVIRFRDSIGEVKRSMKRGAQMDGIITHITVPLDPGGHGKHAFQDHAKNLSGYVVKKAKTEKSKIERFLPFAAAAENGLVKMVEAEWNNELMQELEGFVGDGKKKDDQVDAISDSYKHLHQGKVIPTNIDIDTTEMYSESIWNI